MRSLHVVVLGGMLCLAGCGGAELAPVRDTAVAERAAALTSHVRVGWHLPLEVTVLATQRDEGAGLSDGQRALLLHQLDQAWACQDRAAFDFFRLELRLADDVERPTVRAQRGSPGLVIELPAGGQEVAGADALLDALAERFEWDATPAWWAGETPEELARALTRDLDKLAGLEDELELECRRLELLGATLLARREADKEPSLTPSEAAFARGAQLRGTFALHRALNTLARWRAVLEAPDFPHPGPARLVLLRARLVFEGCLGWLLQDLVGGRAVLRVWDDSWWHRNPLYKALDPSVDLHGLDEQGRTIPAGSVRALLQLRCDMGLSAFLERVDQACPDLEALVPIGGPLREPCLRARQRVGPARRRVDERAIPFFTAWKELWDARLKGGVTLPFYGLVSSVSRFLGHTRLVAPQPAVSPTQLAALEALLRPGDIVLVRQDWFLSNAFLPGFWPHAMLYLGPREAWEALRLPDGSRLGDDPLAQRVAAGLGEEERVLEAVSAGVVLSTMLHAAHKDYVVALRPDLPEAEVAAALRRAFAFYGRPYDFDFDFASDDRVVCTELVYRAYDPQLNFRVQAEAEPPPVPRVPGVIPVAGRETMPANEVARYALYMLDHPQPADALRYPGRKLRVLGLLDRARGGGAELHLGPAAEQVLRLTVDR
mgnify:CR=1 FL=1